MVTYSKTVQCHNQDTEIFYKKLGQISSTILKLEKAVYQLQDAVFIHINGGVGVQKKMSFLPVPTLIGLLTAGAACEVAFGIFKDAGSKKSGKNWKLWMFISCVWGRGRREAALGILPHQYKQSSLIQVYTLLAPKNIKNCFHHAGRGYLHH